MGNTKQLSGNKRIPVPKVLARYPLVLIMSPFSDRVSMVCKAATAFSAE